MTEWQRWQQWAGRTFLGLVVLLLLTYAGDWLLWRVGVARGTGMGSVQVTRMVVAPLKGSREEYYMDGTEDMPCSHSLLPQGGNQACWWLTKHRVVFER